MLHASALIGTTLLIFVAYLGCVTSAIAIVMCGKGMWKLACLLPVGVAYYSLRVLESIWRYW